MNSQQLNSFLYKENKMKQPKNKSEKLPFSAVKNALEPLDRKGLLTLVEDLYALNEENRTFILTRYGLVDELDPYKKVIRENVYPDNTKPIRLGEARKAFNQFKKAVGTPEGLLELAVYYVECGTDCTMEFGDIDEPFYNSMESMLDQAVKLLDKVELEVKERYRPRFKTLMDKTYGKIGWGYGDYLADEFYENYD